MFPFFKKNRVKEINSMLEANAMTFFVDFKKALSHTEEIIKDLQHKEGEFLVADATNKNSHNAKVVAISAALAALSSSAATATASAVTKQNTTVTITSAQVTPEAECLITLLDKIEKDFGEISERS